MSGIRQPGSQCDHATTAQRGGRRAAMRLLSVCLDIRVRPHLVALVAACASGWHVTEIRPSIGAPAQWRVTIERYGAVAIVVLDAADPDAALEELARYTAADAEDAEDIGYSAQAQDARTAGGAA